MRFGTKTLLALFPATAAFITVGQKSGYWPSAGILAAVLLIAWAVRSKERGIYYLPARVAAGLVGLASLWTLAVDMSEFVDGCPDCITGRFITQYRLLGFPIKTNVYETRSIIDRALADLGAPCTHRGLSRTYTHRYWGLLICGCACWDCMWGLGGDDGYSDFVSARIQARGVSDPAFAADLHRRVIDHDDKRYFWQAFMIDQMAPEWIHAHNTREALSWLKGSSDADYRSLSTEKSNEKSIAWVQGAYDAGATRVFAVEIQPYEWNQTRSVNRVLVELPTDPKLRAQLIDWLGKQSKEPYDRPEDFGQSYFDF